MLFTSVFTVVVVPVVIGVLRLLFASELKYLAALVFTYFWRPFDIDENGETHDWCMLHSSASGEWSCVSLLYKFNPFNGTSCVHVHRYNDNWECIHVERIRFADWMTMRKAVIVQPSNELKRKLKNQQEDNVEYSI